MLGQLLNWAPSRRAAGHALSRGGSHDSQHGLESVTEDAHTQALLFPASVSRDFSQPLASETLPSAFDELGPDSGLPTDADVRVLVAQDESAGQPKAILFDSRPPQTSFSANSPGSDRPPSSFSLFRERLPQNDPPSLSHSNTLPAHGRRPSYSQASADSRAGRGSVSSTSSFLRQSSDSPWQASLPQRGHIRGHSNSSISVPTSSRRLAKDADEELQSCLECMFGSAALRYTGKTTKVHILSKDQGLNAMDRTGSSSAFTLQPVARPTTSSSHRPFISRLHSRYGSYSDDKSSRKILITRVFTVQRQSTNNTSAGAPQSGSSVGDAPAQTSGAARPRRQPVYAISLLIRIPAQSVKRKQPKSPSNSEFLSSWSSSLISDSARSSHGSDSMLESTIFDTNFGSLSSLADALDDDDSMSSVTKHWIVISKVLDQMQTAVETQVLVIRDEAGHQLRRTGSLPGSLNRPLQMAPPDTVGLQAYALSGDDSIEAAVESAATRLGQVFTAKQAVSGQGLWGIWKDEARWVDRWARTSEHSTLLTDLLSAFLAMHTDWVESFEGPHARKKIRGRESAASASSRTVVLSNNKMKARRFVFLLAAFLPKSRDILPFQESTPFGSERGEVLASPVRLSRHSTARTESRSEHPSGLRRNSRDQGGRYSSRPLSDLTAAIEFSRSGLTRSRTNASVQSGSPGSDRFTTTDLSLANMSVAHFAPAVPDASLKFRRGSSASARLLENLQTIPTSAIASPQHSPVATRSRKASIELRPDQLQSPSVFSGSPSRRETTESTVTGPSEAGNKLELMVTQLQHTGQGSSSPVKESSKLSVEDATSGDKVTAPRDIPTPRQKPSDPPDLPFSLSINDKDGFVDVDIPLESYGASLQSLSSREHSDRGHNALPMPVRAATSDLAVGGYLQTFCQDLTLQAVKPYNNLENDLRSALGSLSENGVSPRSSSSDQATSWPVKSSILVVNVDTGDIRCLSLRVAPASQPKADEPASLLDMISDDAVTPDTTDARLSTALSKILQTSEQQNRTGNARVRGYASGSIMSSSPASSAGTSMVGTPPGPGLSAMSDSVRGEGAGKVLFEALEEVMRSARAGPSTEGGSSLVQAVRERLVF